MGTNYYLVKTKPTLVAPLHIGKYSGGWKFVFHYVNKYDTDWEVELHDYEEWVEFLEELMDRKEAVILDEYEEELNFIEFISMVQKAQRNENPDNFTYARNINGYRFETGEFY